MLIRMWAQHQSEERGAVHVCALHPGATLSLVRFMLIRVCGFDHFLSRAAVHAPALHPGAARCVGIDTQRSLFTCYLCEVCFTCVAFVSGTASLQLMDVNMQGPRTCLGQHLALLEAGEVLALLQNL
jgi:hypothetical protein